MVTIVRLGYLIIFGFFMGRLGFQGFVSTLCIHWLLYPIKRYIARLFCSVLLLSVFFLFLIYSFPLTGKSLVDTLLLGYRGWFFLFDIYIYKVLNSRL